MIFIYLFFINILSLSLMGIDKRKASFGARRIPERTLFLSAALGGSVGALAGMFLFRHKTRHLSFRIGLPLILASHLAIAFFLIRMLRAH